MSKQQEISGHGGGEPMRGNSGFVKILPQQECNGTYEGCECHCRQPECGGHQNTSCEHCRPQQDTGYATTVKCELHQCKNCGEIISEQQGYQRGYDKRTQEVLEMLSPESGDITWVDKWTERDLYRAELRKKLAEKMNE